MRAQPEISVIIPVYNVERYLSLCIESVLQQSFQNFEIILVDDGSPDNSPAICDNYSARDSRIKVVHKRNGGLGYARNSGLDVACGEYVCFLDSDDYLALNTLEYCYNLVRQEDADEIRYMFRRFNEATERNFNDCKINNNYIIGEGKQAIDPILNIISLQIYGSGFSAPTTASSCTAFYRREIIERHHIRFLSEREILSEDYIFNFDFGIHCKKIIYTPNEFYNYRLNLQSLTRSLNFERLARAIAFSKLYSERLKAFGDLNAEINAMGYVVGEMRNFNKQLVLSKLSYSQKRALFEEVLSDPYVNYIKKIYPISRLPLMQRLAFELHVKHKFLLTYIISRIKLLYEKCCDE